MKNLFSLAATLLLLASCSKSIEHLKQQNETGVFKTPAVTNAATNVSRAGTCIDPNGKPVQSNYGIAIDPDGKTSPINNSGTSLDTSGKPVHYNAGAGIYRKG